MEAVKVLDLPMHKVGVAQVINKILESVRSCTKVKIFHLNIHAFCIAFKDSQFRHVLNEADVVFCDGFGVKIGAKLLGKSIGERMTPPDWIDQLCSALVENKCSVFLLGDEGDVAQKCARQLLDKYPGLNVRGTHHGFFDKTGIENEQVLQTINEAKPDVILVGFGMPLQEKWIIDNYQKVDACAFITVGAMFRWIARVERRAPKLLSANGFEGVWRLVTQPRKVWKRYIYEVPLFFIKVFYSALFKRDWQGEDIDFLARK